MNKSMRYLSWIPGGYFGGCEDYGFRIARYLTDEGWDTKCVVKNKSVADAGLKYISPRHISVPRVPFKAETRSRNAIKQSVKEAVLYTSYRYILNKDKPEIIHAVLPWHFHSIYFIKQCIKLRYPVLATYQLVAPDRVPPLEQIELIQKMVRSPYLTLSAISNNNRDLLSEYYKIEKSSIPVIPNRPRASAQISITDEVKHEHRQRFCKSENIPKNSTLLMTVASLHHQKGIDTLIHGAHELIKIIPNAYFCIAGNGNDKETLVKLANDLGVANHIKFLGRRNDVDELLNIADLFLFPTRYEGESFALLEAARSRLPIIASNASGISETFRDQIDALLFPVGDTRLMNDHILKLITNPHIGRELARSAYERVQGFSEHEMMAATRSLLIKCFNKCQSNEL